MTTVIVSPITCQLILLKATETFQYYVDKIFAGQFKPHKLYFSLNPFMLPRTWRFIFSLLSLGLLAPLLLKDYYVSDNEIIWGAFWRDIFSLQIKTSEKSDHKFSSFKKDLEIGKENIVSKAVERSTSYLQRVIIFISAPKVNFIWRVKKCTVESSVCKYILIDITS